MAFLLLVNYPKLYSRVPVINKSLELFEINQTNITNQTSRNITNITTNNVTTKPTTPTTKLTMLTTQELKKLNEDCMLKYECKKSKDNYYWFNCYYEPKDKKCHCYKGDFEQCNITGLAELQAKRKGVLKSIIERINSIVNSIITKTMEYLIIYKGYIITGLVILIIVLVILYYKIPIMRFIIDFFTKEE